MLKILESIKGQNDVIISLLEDIRKQRDLKIPHAISEIRTIHFKDLPFDGKGVGNIVFNPNILGKKFVYFIGLRPVEPPPKGFGGMCEIWVGGERVQEPIPMEDTFRLFLFLKDKLTIRIISTYYANRKVTFEVFLVVSDLPVPVFGSPVSTIVDIPPLTIDKDPWATGDFQEEVIVPVTFTATTHLATLIPFGLWKKTGITPKTKVKFVQITIQNSDGSEIDTTPGTGEPRWNLVSFVFIKETEFGKASFNRHITNTCIVHSDTNDKDLQVRIVNIPPTAVGMSFVIVANVVYAYI